MEKLKLIFPSDDYKFQYLDFIKECKKDIQVNRFECCIPLSTNDTFVDDIITLGVQFLMRTNFSLYYYIKYK